jgi:hypothetical protein
MSSATASAIALLKALLKFAAHNSMLGGASGEQEPCDQDFILVDLGGRNKNRLPVLAAIDIALTTASSSRGLVYSASRITLPEIRKDD